jgi:hypothetical protein
MGKYYQLLKLSYVCTQSKISISERLGIIIAYMYSNL